MGQFIFIIILLLAAFVGGSAYATKRYTGDWSPMPLISTEASDAACGEFSEEEVEAKIEAAVNEAVADAKAAMKAAQAEAEAAAEEAAAAAEEALGDEEGDGDDAQ